MGRKPASKTSALIGKEFHDRLARLSELIWKSNQSQMGRDLGIDQSSLSKVLAGKQQPSAALIERLANWKGVNPGWLLCGKGEPLLEGPFAPGVGLYRPLLGEILTGLLSESPGLLTGVSYPVAGAHYTETSYWFRVPVNDPITFDSTLGVKSSDLLLMETDPRWTQSIRRVRGKVAGLLVEGALAGRRRAVLGLVDAQADEGLAHIDIRLLPDIHPVKLYLSKGDPTPAWLIASSDPGEAQEAASRMPGEVLTMDRVTAVCVNLSRPSW